MCFMKRKKEKRQKNAKLFAAKVKDFLLKEKK